MAGRFLTRGITLKTAKDGPAIFLPEGTLISHDAKGNVLVGKTEFVNPFPKDFGPKMRKIRRPYSKDVPKI